MPFAKKTAALALSTALLLSLAPSAFADEAVSGMAPAKPISSSLPIGAGGSSGSGSSGASTAVNAKISKDAAVEAAKQAVSIPSDYVLQNISFSSSMSGSGGAWGLSFEKRDQNRYLGSLNVTINADNGQLIQYSSYVNDPDQVPSYPPKVDFAGAKTLAQELLQKMHAGEIDSLLYNTEFEKSFKPPLSGQVRYTIRYDHAVNGVPFPQNYIQFSFDGDGKWVDYQYRMNDQVEFGDASRLLSPEDALEKYRAAIKAELNYIVIHPSKGNRKPVPVLSYSTPLYMMDAVTGSLLDSKGQPLGELPAPQPLTEKPLAVKPAGGQNLTQEQAIAKVNALLPPPEGAVLQNASFNENVDTKQGTSVSSWGLSWQTKPDAKTGDSIYISASVNSQTGEILSYNRYKPYSYDKAGSSEEEKLALESTEKAKGVAVDFVKKVMPHFSSELFLDDANLAAIPLADLQRMRSISFNFKRLVNGIEAESESLYVGVNLYTGEVESYWSNLSDLVYPNDAGKAIDAEKAEELLLSPYTLEKRYMVIGGDSGYGVYGKTLPYPGPDASTSTPQKAQVVYMPVSKNPSDYVFLDAVTGEWKTRDTGEPTTLGQTVVTDLESHWAKRELQLMVDYKAIDAKDGLVNPDQAIKRGELIKMLIIAMNGGYYNATYAANRKATFSDVANGSEYFAYVESAVDQNLIDPSKQATFNPESSMSREEMAELLVRALGYSKLAATPGLFNLSTADADAITLKGHVAIITSLGIMSAANGVFDPATQVTRAQAATAFFRYLEKRAALQDTPIRAY
ncbi:S-layer homology domain-containing protein [Paenibacillus koleovorans]|uniref:S-layer homology domain-containing protein n=1 Tax=Paenibacillus koleovorans TaxID=121608 RepID=UPI000FD6FC7D|nr:S-layer homology domain-containing protein [Paenibacillus koleovorans]